MTDVQHAKFAQLMTDVETLEDQIAELTKKNANEPRLIVLREKLAEARNHLEQLSNGCGTGRNPGA